MPIGGTHRLVNPGKVPVGSYLGEDDIVRFEQVYHRECVDDKPVP
jgi:hypothetical protein